MKIYENSFSKFYVSVEIYSVECGDGTVNFTKSF